jgi:hypothetical protein
MGKSLGRQDQLRFQELESSYRAAWGSDLGHEWECLLNGRVSPKPWLGKDGSCSKTHRQNWAWWCMPTIPALGRWRQLGHEFHANLGCISETLSWKKSPTSSYVTKVHMAWLLQVPGRIQDEQGWVWAHRVHATSVPATGPGDYTCNPSCSALSEQPSSHPDAPGTLHTHPESQSPLTCPSAPRWPWSILLTYLQKKLIFNFPKHSCLQSSRKYLNSILSISFTCQCPSPEIITLGFVADQNLM